MGSNLSQFLEPLAAWFRTLNLPEPIVQWGHPLMMGIVIFVMGSFVGWVGWRGRLAADGAVGLESKAKHRQVAPLMLIFLAAGYTGGVLSLTMQQHSLLESPHFWTGSIVLILLGINAAISLTGFGGNKAVARTIHAYLGTVALGLLFIHAAFGLQLGLALQ